MKWILYALVLLVSIGSKGHAQDKLEVGIFSFPPYFTIEDNGEMGGLWKDMIDRQLNTMGITPVYRQYPPPRLAQNMIFGKTDLTVSAHHIAVDKHVYYSKHPVSRITLNVYRKKDRAPIKALSDLVGKSIILIRGYAYNGRIRFLSDPVNRITVIKAASHNEAVRQLAMGKVDYLLDYQKPVENALARNNIAPDSFTADTLSTYNTYFVVSKHTKNAKQLIKALNSGLNTGY